MNHVAPKLLGVDETRQCYFPDLSPSTFRHWIASGQAPPSARIGRRRYFRVDGPDGIEAWIDAQFDRNAAR